MLFAKLISSKFPEYIDFLFLWEFALITTEIRVLYEQSGYPRVQIYEEGHNRSYKKVQRYVRISSSILLYRHYTEGKRFQR
jgi:hypothetical protein